MTLLARLLTAAGLLAAVSGAGLSGPAAAPDSRRGPGPQASRDGACADGAGARAAWLAASGGTVAPGPGNRAACPAARRRRARPA